MARKIYSEEEKAAALACLEANSGNYKKTESETGIRRATLREWRKASGIEPSTIATLKKELVESYLDKAKRAREVLLDRMIAVAETEKDLFKLSGAFKTVADAASAEEVSNAVASRIRGHSAVSESAPAQGIGSTGGSGSPDAAFN